MSYRAGTWLIDDCHIAFIMIASNIILTFTSWYGKDREYLASTKKRKIARLILKDGSKGLILHAVWTTR